MTFAPKGGYKQPTNTSPDIKNTSKSVSTALPSNNLPSMSRAVVKTSLYYYKLYSLTWRWSLASLAFDFCLLLFLPLVQNPVFSKDISSIIEIGGIALIALSSTWFFRNWSLNIIASWQHTREKLFKLVERNPIFVLALLGLLVAFEVFLKVGEVGILSSIFAIIVLLGALKPIREGIRERIAKDKNLSIDLTAQVERFNFSMFLLHFIPLLAARFTILISALAFPLSQQLNPNFLLMLSIGCILLSLMHAEEQHFMFACPRCGTKTSRFLAPYKSCLACLAVK